MTPGPPGKDKTAHLSSKAVLKCWEASQSDFGCVLCTRSDVQVGRFPGKNPGGVALPPGSSPLHDPGRQNKKTKNKTWSLEGSRASSGKAFSQEASEGNLQLADKHEFQTHTQLMETTHAHKLETFSTCQ